MSQRDTDQPLQTHAEILAEYEKWCDDPNPVPKGWRQRRGYAFERMLKALFAIERLDPHTNYRPDGEEIDGSIVVDQRTYLLEAKWWGKPLPASQLYAFKGKIDGKLAGTLGIVISQSGFADDAVDALVSGKGVNMILFDGPDFHVILKEQICFTDALRQKLRYAAEYGQPFQPIMPNTASGSPAASLPHDDNPGSLDDTELTANVVVEGPSDEEGLRQLLATFDPAAGQRIKIWPALGRSNLLSLAQDLTQRGQANITVFLDTDGVDQVQLAELDAAAHGIGARLVAFDPSFIEVLETACDTDYYNSVPATGIPTKHARRMATHANIELLWHTSPALHAWWRSIAS